jgi:FkbM family methyltransferase
MLQEPDEQTIISNLGINHSDLILFDVGAYDFITGIYFKQWFPKAKVYSFEPDIENIRNHRNSAIDAGIHTYPYALGDKNDVVKFYPSLSIEGRYHKQAGSINKPIIKNGTVDEQIEFDRCKFDMNGYDVTVKRLDTVCEENDITHIDYMHIDAQSYEKNIINGIGDVPVKFILTETVNFHQYESNIKHEDEFHTFMLSKNYEIVQKYKYDTLYRKI